jgi:hypothetical protein
LIDWALAYLRRAGLRTAPPGAKSGFSWRCSVPAWSRAQGAGRADEVDVAVDAFVAGGALVGIGIGPNEERRGPD